MKKKFDIVDVILEKFDFAPISKERRQAISEEHKALDILHKTFNPKQKKLYLDYETKKTEYLIMHEKDVANYVFQCLCSIFK